MLLEPPFLGLMPRGFADGCFSVGFLAGFFDSAVFGKGFVGAELLVAERFPVLSKVSV